MIQIAILVFALFVVSQFAKERITSEWLGPDKPLHAAASFAAAIGATIVISTDPPTAFIIAMLPGIAKELYDTRSGGSGWSYKDLVADAVGAAAGVAFTMVILQVFK